MSTRFRFISQSARYVMARVQRFWVVRAGLQMVVCYRERQRNARDRQILLQMSEQELVDLALGRGEIMRHTRGSSRDQSRDNPT